MNYEIFLRLAEQLNDEEVDYILIGGVAMGLHGIVRGTEDIDLYLKPDAENIERLKRALRKLWNDPAIDDIQAEEILKEYPTIRYGPPNGELTVDLITRLGDALSYDDLESEVIELHGIPIRVATVKTLYAMKRDTLRAIDRADAAMLEDLLNAEEE